MCQTHIVLVSNIRQCSTYNRHIATPLTWCVRTSYLSSGYLHSFDWIGRFDWLNWEPNPYPVRLTKKSQKFKNQSTSKITVQKSLNRVNRYRLVRSTVHTPYPSSLILPHALIFTHIRVVCWLFSHRCGIKKYTSCWAFFSAVAPWRRKGRKRCVANLCKHILK